MAQVVVPPLTQEGADAAAQLLERADERLFLTEQGAGPETSGQGKRRGRQKLTTVPLAC